MIENIKKLTKEEFEAVLHKNFLNCTEEEMRFAFNLFSFQLKEFKKEAGRTIFEVHYRTYYLMSIGMTSDVLIFKNEWVNFAEKGKHGICTEPMDTLAEIMVMFLETFGPNILKQARYEPFYDPNTSVYSSAEEAQEYIEHFKKVSDAIVSIANIKKSQPEFVKPKGPIH